MTSVGALVDGALDLLLQPVGGGVEDSGPIVASAELGSPGSTAVSAAVNFSRNGSYRSSTTMNRLAALQAWPAFSSRAPTAASTAASRSSVLSRMNGSEPPSSSTTFLRLRPAISATAAPARSEPVSETPCTRGSAITISIWSLVA